MHGVFVVLVFAVVRIAGFAAEVVPPPPVPLEREAPWRLQDFSKDAGIERRRVFDVVFKKDGTAWFACSDGLYRYDGYAWKRFTKADGLPSNFVRTVMLASDGALWVGLDDGAGVFEGGRFSRRATQGRLAGPNVRRIVETSDGSLWFACDRWPNPSTSGGLTRMKKGVFRTYGPKDGLPSDYVYTVFERKDGRLIALTVDGAAMQEGDRWVTIPSRYAPTTNPGMAAAETADGALFLQGMKGVLALRDGALEELALDPGWVRTPLCVVRDGTLIAAVALRERGTVAFHRWTGRGFERASADFALPGPCTLQQVRQAPDGSIWVVGQGLILRWEHVEGPWAWHPALPPPVLEDRRGRIWFANNRTATFIDGTGRVRVEGMRAPLFEDGNGEVWSAGEHGLLRWSPERVETVPPDVCGVTKVQGGVTDNAGCLWIFGTDRAGASRLSLRADGVWKVVEGAGIAGRVIMSLAADAHEGVWALLGVGKGVDFEVAKASGDSLRIVPVLGQKPVLQRLGFCVNGLRLYLFNNTGLWEAPIGPTLVFRQLSVEGCDSVEFGAGTGDVTAFVSQEGSDGRPSIILHRSDRWIRHPVRAGQLLWMDRRGWLMVADGDEFVLWQTREWDAPAYVNLPTSATITSMLRSSKGEYWLGTNLGVLHHRPGNDVPETVIRGPSVLLKDAPGALMAQGVAPVRTLAHPQRFTFSWRVDSGSWGGFTDWPADGIPLGRFAAGKHRIEVRARSGVENVDPSPAEFSFEVIPIPIQDRAWFKSVVAGVFVILAGLSMALWRAGRRLRRLTSELEGEVSERTTELREDIARREQSERAQQTIAQISELALTTATLAEFFAAIHMAIGKLISAEGFFIALFDFKTQEVYFPFYVDNVSTKNPGRRRYRGLTEYVLNTGQPLLVSRSQIEEMTRKGLVDPAPFPGTSWLGVPLRNQERAIGVMGIQRYHEGCPFQNKDQELLTLVSYSIANAIERKQNEQAVQEMQMRYRLIWEQSVDAMRMTDADGVVLKVNDAYTRLAGIPREAIEGKLFTEAYVDNTLDSLVSILAEYRDMFARGDFVKKRERRVTFVGGRFAVLDIANSLCDLPDGKPVVFSILRDVTDIKQAEAEKERLQNQLLQSKKMEMVGRLAGGVAHDFNNMLQAILGNTSIALETLPSDHPAREHLEEIQKSALHSTDLTRQLLAFARKQTVQPKILDLNAVVTASFKMLRRLIGEDVELAWHPGENVWPVCIDPSQVDQILTNLCVNARDAIKGTGRVTIETINAALDDTYVQMHPECVPGDYVIIAVSDTGHGMDAETRAHLFEPFFTTKEPGKGTGLGLATVFGIIKQNRGLVNVYSEPGKGSTFRIYLPRAASESVVAVEKQAEAVVGGNETILLVEDEPQVLRLGKRILQQNGYDVLTASAPNEALMVAADSSRPIHLLITDVVMPEMNGKELLVRLREARPELRCVFVSGYTADVIAHHGVIDTGVEFLQKPFTNTDLATKVRRVLDAPPSSASQPVK